MLNERDRNILTKIISEIDFLLNDINGIGLNDFMTNERLRRSVALTLLNIGELANHISKDIKNAYPDVLFHKVIALRHVTAHGYHQLKFDLVWKTATTDILIMKKQIMNILHPLG
ncbi:MAG: DUF86 domain-containing protein [Firmicutes bacterium]|nr:DUF86 domain-containing protein [Bacillota bacterium]